MKNKNICIYAIICIIIIPFVINELILIPRKFDIVGDGKDWLIFWATYLAAFASSLMVYISMKNIKENNIENLNNRKLQVNVLKYQEEQHKLEILKEKLSTFYESIDMPRLHSVASEIQYNNEYKNSLQKIQELIRAFKESLFELFLFMPENIKKKYNKEFVLINDRNYNYSKMLLELNLFSSFLINVTEHKESYDDYLKIFKNEIKPNTDYIIGYILDNCDSYQELLDSKGNIIYKEIVHYTDNINNDKEKLRTLINNIIQEYQIQINSILIEK